jgi:NADH/NAD ratio-sensing transcriptional regulator Rex
MSLFRTMDRLQYLAGVRDTWQNKVVGWHASGEQAAALTFYSWEHWRAKIDWGQYDFSKELAVGKMIYDSRMTKVDKFAQEAFKFEDAGYKVAVFNDPDRYTSDVSEVLVQQGFNVIAGFHYAKKNLDDENPLMCFSVRTDGTIDASDLAKTIPGGGGHTKAAGFAEVIDLKEINAFAAFRDIFEDYINYHKE